jgi:hypothetical protein
MDVAMDAENMLAGAMAGALVKRCKTCKHWGRRGVVAFDESNQRLRSCNAPSIYYGYRVNEAEVADNGVRVEDDEGWGMRTGPEFGCVLHEPT